MISGNKISVTQHGVRELALDTFDTIVDKAAISGSSDDMNMVLSILGYIVNGSLMITE